MAKLQVGDKMPNFVFQTATRQGVSMEEAVKGKKKTVLWVLRYIGCTSCRYDVHLISQRYNEILAKDAQVYVLMQSEPEIVKEETASSPLPFEIICDTKFEIYDTLEIQAPENKADLVGTNPAVMAKLMAKGAKAKAAGFSHGKYEGRETQLPAMFILDEDCNVIYAHYAKNIMDMPDVDGVLALL